MATNKSLESPNFDKISSEAGNFTSDAVNLLWAAQNDSRATQRRDARRAIETLSPALLTLTAAASVNDLDLGTASIVSFIGAAAENFTGMKAPETGQARIVFVQNSGAGTITVKHEATSEAANRLTTKTGADVAMATAAGMIFIYLASRWRQVA